MSRASKGLLNRLAHLVRARMRRRNRIADRQRHARLLRPFRGFEALEPRVLLSHSPLPNGPEDVDVLLGPLADDLSAVYASASVQGQDNASDAATDPTLISFGIPTWQPLGPTSIQNGQAIIPPQGNPVVGAVHDIAVHPNGRDVWIATTNGGVWHTTNIRAQTGGLPNPVWTQLNDQLPSLSLGAIAVGANTTAATAANSTELFVGTGSFSNSGIIASGAQGVLRSRNGGATWQQLGARQFQNLRITSVVPTSIVSNGGRVVFVSALDDVNLVTNTVRQRGGVFRGVIIDNPDGSVTDTWTPLSTVAGPLPVGAGSDLIADPTNNMAFYAAIIGSGVFRTPDGGVTWNAVNTGLTGAATADRIALATPPPGSASTSVFAGMIGRTTTLTPATTAPTNRLIVSSVSGFSVGSRIRVNPSGGFGDAGAPIATLTADATAGTSTLTVDNAAAIRASGVNQIVILSGATREFVNINTAAASTPTTIPIVGTLSNTHRQGVTVSTVSESLVVRAVNPSDPMAGGQPTLLVDNDNNPGNGNQPTIFTYPMGTEVQLIGTTGNLQAVFQTTNQGGMWNAMPAIPGGLHNGGQGVTNFSIVADPNDPDVVFVGGDVQAAINATNPEFTGRHFRLDASPTAPAVGAAQMGFIGANQTSPHADSRVMVFLPPPAGAPAGTPPDILEGDDGGIYMLSNPNAAARVWSSLNGNLANTESYTVAYDSVNNVAVAGNQDTGSIRQAAQGSAAWSSVPLGTLPNPLPPPAPASIPFFHQADGNTQVVDVATNPASPLLYSLSNNFSAFYQVQYNNTNGVVDRIVPPAGFMEPANQNLTASLVRLAAPGSAAHIGPIPAPPTAPTVIDPFQDTAHLSGLVARDRRLGFVPQLPFAVNTVNPSRIMLGHFGLYESTNRGQTVTQVQGDLNPPVTAIVYGGVMGGTANPDVFYAARGDSLFHRSAPPPPPPAPPAAPPAFGLGVSRRRVPGAQQIRDIVVDPTNWQTVYVVDQNNVWRSTDAGQNWNMLTGNLAGQALNLQSIELVQSGTDQILLVSGLGGVYRVINPNPGMAATLNWKIVGKDLPNVLVMDVHYDAADDVLLAGTLGRGVWTIPNALAGSGVIDLNTLKDKPSILITGTIDDPGEMTNDSFRIRLNPSTPRIVEIFVNNVSTNPNFSAPVDSLEAISIIDSTGNDELIVDVSNGLIVGPRINFTAGEGLDRIEVISGPNQTAKLASDVVTITGGSQVQRIGTAFVESFAGITFASLTDSASADAAQLTASDGQPMDIATVVGDGLAALARKSDSLLPALDVAGFRTSLTEGFKDPFERPVPVSDLSRSAGKAAARALVGAGGGNLLSHIFSSGDVPLTFSELGGFVNTPQEVVDRFDALDDIAGNVTFNETDEEVRFDVQVVTDYRSLVNLDIEALAGLVGFQGQTPLDAEARIDFVLGVDSDGFFIDTTDGDSEIVLRNMRFLEEPDASGRAGFLGLSLGATTIQVDPDVQFVIDLKEPDGADGDGKLRLSEFDLLTGEAFSDFEVVQAAGADDLVIASRLSLAPFIPGLGEAVELADAVIELRWPDITDPLQVTVSSQGGLGQEILDLLNFKASDFVAGITSLAGTIQSFTGLDLLSVDLPLLNKSLGDVMGKVPAPLVFEGQQVAEVSPVRVSEGFKEFDVTLQSQNPAMLGIGQGNSVRYRGANGETFEGEIAQVQTGQFTIRFDESKDQNPDTTASQRIEVLPGGGLGDRLEAALGDIVDFAQTTPTFQELLGELGGLLGVDVERFNPQLVGQGDNLSLHVTLPVDPDPITFNEAFDFSAGVEALSFNTSGDVELSIDPSFELTVGLRLSGGVDLADRFFLVDNDDPEISIDVTAQLDDPRVFGSVGFLDVILEEESLAQNDGIVLSGSLTFDLDDPGSGLQDDGRIELGEISLGNLRQIVDPGIEAALDIDGLEIGVAGAGGLADDLETIRISLDGENAGKIDSLEALQQLPMTLLNSIEGLDDFLSFDNLSAVAVQLMLEQLGDWLDGVQDASVLSTEIPLTGKTLGDLVDVGQAFLDNILNPLDNPTVLAADLLQSAVLTEDATLSPEAQRHDRSVDHRARGGPRWIT